MDISLKWREITVNLKDEIIKAEVRPMKQGEFLLLTPFLKDLQGSMKDDKHVIDHSTMLRVLVDAAPVIKGAARNITGITADGTPITPEQLAEESQLLELAGKVLIEILSISSLKAGEEKNSEGPSDTPA